MSRLAVRAEPIRCCIKQHRVGFWLLVLRIWPATRARDIGDGGAFRHALLTGCLPDAVLKAEMDGGKWLNV